MTVSPPRLKQACNTLQFFFFSFSFFSLMDNKKSIIARDVSR